MPDDLLLANPPILGPAPRVLILGSFPGPLSLAERKYYAHPRNDFWPILSAVLGGTLPASYEARVEALVRAGIAVWDVVERCRRPSSQDADIVDARAADVAGLLAARPSIRLLVINGKSVERLYRRLVGPLPPIAVVAPSTSPAAARVPRAVKARIWAELIRPILSQSGAELGLP